uniref:Uncharacterized protein n=1 Tax=Aegilops tauschii subsp. strangulata TaxID=200361 RepID=A0A453H4F7_AEGTS
TLNQIPFSLHRTTPTAASPPDPLPVDDSDPLLSPSIHPSPHAAAVPRTAASPFTIQPRSLHALDAATDGARPSPRSQIASS